ncbi:MAG TPA: hypothetical protein VFP33_12030 [Gallionella sp.]|nr:hypothetical protein [Gallionella sp.]
MNRTLLNRYWQAYALLLACSVVATYPLLGAGFAYGDLALEFTRVSEYAHLLKAGIFPVRWGADLEGGYGYPIYNFFPPLFLLISSIPSIAAGLAVASAIKIAVFLLTLAGGIGMYWFAREHFGKSGGLLSACLYILAPYHFIDLFNRNAFSEFTALAVAPFVFYGLARIAKEHEFQLRTALVLTASGSFFVLSHNLSVAMYAPLFLAYFFVNIAATGQWHRIGRLILPLVLTVAVTAFYTLPLLFEVRFVQTWMLSTGRFDVLQNLLPIGGITARITFFSWLLFIGAMAVVMLRKRHIPAPTFAVLCAFGGLLLLSLFMITPASRLIWSQAEFLKWLQFPWRLLSPATFLICFFAGALVYSPFPRNVLLYGGIALGIVSLVTFSAVNRWAFVSLPEEQFTPSNIRESRLPTTVFSEYLPIWVKDRPPPMNGPRLVATRQDVEIDRIEESPLRYAYEITAAGKSQITVHLYYFPGWRLQVNGRELAPQITEQGLMRFRLPQGRSMVQLTFGDTPVRAAGNAISILGCVLFGLLLLRVVSPARRRVLPSSTVFP